MAQGTAFARPIERSAIFPKKGSHELQAKFPHRKPPWDSTCRVEQRSTLYKVTNKIVDFVNAFYVNTEMQCLAITVY